MPKTTATTADPTPSEPTTEEAPPPPAPKKDTKRVSVQVPHKFSDAELVALSRELAAHRNQQSEYDADFESLKADHKSKVKCIEAAADRLWSKLESGKEMREQDAEVTFNEPRRGVKTLRLINKDGTVSDEVLREEEMTPLDLDRGVFKEVEELGLTEGGGEEEARSGTLSTTAAGEQAGETPLGDALGAAAADTEQVLVDINLDQYGDDYRIALIAFKKQALKDGWPVPAVELIAKQVKAADTVPKALDILKAHCVNPADKDPATEAAE